MVMLCRSSGRNAATTAMIASPSAARSARISMMLSGPHSLRIATAITQNDNSAPIIQATTLASCRMEVTRLVQEWRV